MLDERVEGDPLEGSRIMLAGRAEEAAASDLEIFRRRYSRPIRPRKSL